MLNEIIDLDKKYYMNTFGNRTPVVFNKGEGIKLYDTEGKVYYDFLAGIAVNALGHSNKDFIDALKAQLEKPLHTSSLYYIENQARLAEKLVSISCADKVFFANSGAEANEGAFKLIKSYFYKKGMTQKTEIITLTNSFHGRTLATVAATGQPKYQKPYKPLLPGFVHVPLNDWDALENALSEKTAAITLELIQGESGIYPVEKEYIGKIRDLCTKNDIILMVDEVQTGIGRTGKMFAYENFDIEPDVFTLAKALGGGIPIGAVCAKDFLAAAFEPGDHGTTFGGNPFATGAALAVLDIIEKDKLVENAKNTGDYFKAELNKLKEKHTLIKDVRGIGLMIGLEIDESVAKEVFGKLFENGFLASLCGGKTLRFVPALIVTKQDIDLLVKVLDKILNEIKK